MNVKIKGNSLTRQVSDMTNMIGEYEGHWSGYVIWFKFNGIKHYIESFDGVRGLDVPCTVKITENGIEVIK